MDTGSNHVFCVTKAGNSANFALCGIITCRAHHNKFCTNKKHQLTSYAMVYKAMSHMMLPCMSKLSPTSTLAA
jgi:citrate lyase synthetase